MTTEPDTRAARRVERYGRTARWFHAGVYISVLLLLATGWWLWAGREGTPSPIARLANIPDTSLHKAIGWAFAGIAIVGILLLGRKATSTFVRESVGFERSDFSWFARWPAATLTGRFVRHEGRFDPGQRIANIVLIVGLFLLTTSGIGMVMVHGGPAFVWLDRVHVYATYVVTLMIFGHVLIACGLLPGYRGVWRSMHLGGRLDPSVAERLWPAWFERRQGGSGSSQPSATGRVRGEPGEEKRGS